MFEYRPDWQKKAKCRGTMADGSGYNFFPVKGESKFVSMEAQEFCRSCSVKKDCLNYALDNNLNDGIWGGLTYRKRLLLKRDINTRLDQ